MTMDIVLTPRGLIFVLVMLDTLAMEFHVLVRDTYDQCIKVKTTWF